MTSCLVVDDSSVIRKVARRILEDFDFVVSEAEDGAEAWDHCRRAMPDVILLDWTLPSVDGIDFVKRLRESEGGTHPKVVFCTSENDVVFMARALRAGADDFLLKPFDKDLFEAKLQDVGLI
jgi:two-component system chemotaxis response regulator CheY